MNVYSDIKNRLAAEFQRRLSLGACDHCGRLPATIQELEAARKFLADNPNDLLMPPVKDVIDDLPVFDEDPESNIERPARTA